MDEASISRDFRSKRQTSARLSDELVYVPADELAARIRVGICRRSRPWRHSFASATAILAFGVATPSLADSNDGGSFLCQPSANGSVWSYPGYASKDLAEIFDIPGKA